MYLGRVVETGATADVFADPRHPYTQMLLAAHPEVGRHARRRGQASRRETPSPYAIPTGCRFHTRCRCVEPICLEQDPPAFPSRLARAAATIAPATCSPKPMSADESDAEITRRLVLGELAAVSRQDPHGLADHFAEHCEFVDLSDGTRIQGKAAFLEDLLGLFTAVPDFHVVESRVIAEGGVVAAEIQLAGTPASGVARHRADRPVVRLGHVLVLRPR